MVNTRIGTKLISDSPMNVNNKIG